MKDRDRTKEQLIDELADFQKRNAELEKAGAKRMQAEQAPRKLNAEHDECVRWRSIFCND